MIRLKKWCIEEKGSQFVNNIVEYCMVYGLSYLVSRAHYKSENLGLRRSIFFLKRYTEEWFDHEALLSVLNNYKYQSQV